MVGKPSGLNEDALSEIIGFVLILALVVVASTLYLLYVVPAEGREDEITHMNQVKDRFISYKTTVDGLWMRATEGVLIAGLSSQDSGTRGVSLSTSFDLGTGGGNTQSSGLFLSFMRPIGSAAKMRIETSDCDRIAVSVNGTPRIINPEDPDDHSIPLGYLSYDTDNYYWIQQRYVYEMGGVFLEQPGDGVSVKVAPALSFYSTTPVDSNGVPSSPIVKLSLFPLTIMGDNRIIGGTGPLRVETRLREDTRLAPNSNGGTIVVKVEARNNEWAEAWQHVFHDAGIRSELPIREDGDTTLGPSYSVSDITEVTGADGTTHFDVELHVRNVASDPPPVLHDAYLDLVRVNLQVSFEYAEA